MKRIAGIVATVMVVIFASPAQAAEVPEPLPVEEMVKRRVANLFDKHDEITALKVLPVLKVRVKAIHREWTQSYADYQRQQEAQRLAAAAPEASQSVSAAPVSGDIWYQLAMCESGMNQQAYNPAGPFYSYFQWMMSTWHAAGGTGDPRNASYATQVAIAKSWLARTSWKQWPACAAKLGLL